MTKFEDFLNEFSVDAMNHQEFIFNALLAALLAWLLGLFYRKFGKAATNRKGFSGNFILLALTTMLIIYIVKSSIALSLGLVGALSIVRFRAAIKEPEELVYLFLVIGIGLGMGAGQAVITIIAFVLIMCLLLIQVFVRKPPLIRTSESMFINISTTVLKAEQVNGVLSEHFKMVELKRLDQLEGRMDLSFVVEAEKVEDVIKAKDNLLQLSDEVNFSFVEQRNLAL